MTPRPATEDDARPDRRRECVGAFAHELVVALMNAELHAPTTATARTQLKTAVAAFGSVLATGVAAPLRVEVRGRALCWEDEDLLGPSLQAGKLLRLMGERGVAALTFDATLDADAIGHFLELLSDPGSLDAFRPAALDAVLCARGIQGVTPELAESSNPTTPQSALNRGAAAPGPDEALESYQQLAAAVQDSHVAASRGKDLEIDLAKGLVERAVARMNAAPSDLLALAVYDDVDRFTVGHSVRVALLALEIARAARATEEQLLLVGTAGLLHDIGKSLVPQEVLFKQGQLEDEEWRAMAEHPRLGAQILIEQDDVHPSAIGAAFCHHMTPGDHGYPTPVAGFDPSGISQLIRICDVFEALTAMRPYKRDLTPLEAMALMNRQADGFDRRWLRFFFRTVGVYPIGTRLRLDTGERGLVIRHGPSCERPVVRISSNADGTPCRADTGNEVVVGVPENGTVRRVAAVIRRRAGVEFEDPSERAVAPIQHGCLGPLGGGHDSCSHG